MYSKINWTVLKCKFAKIIQIFCQKGQIRSRSRILPKSTGVHWTVHRPSSWKLSSTEIQTNIPRPRFYQCQVLFLVSVKLLQNVWTVDNASFLQVEREREPRSVGLTYTVKKKLWAIFLLCLGFLKRFGWKVSTLSRLRSRWMWFHSKFPFF